MKSQGTHPLSNDPRLTAYALGETDDPEVAQAVAASPELQAEVAEIRNLTSALGQGFAAEADPLLGGVEAKQPSPFPRKRLAHWALPLSGAIAACLVLAAVMSPQFNLGDKTDENAPPPVTTATDTPEPGSKINPEAIKPAAVEVSQQTDSGTQKPAVVDETLEQPGSAVADLVPAAAAQMPQQPVAIEPLDLAAIARAEQEMLKEISIQNNNAAGARRSGDGSLMLPPFEVEASADVGYMATNSTSGTSLNMRVRELPMPFDAINREKVGDLQATTLRESLRYTAGVFTSHYPQLSREAYDSITAAGFVTPAAQPLSTFSIDVDTASYANVRRMLQGGATVPAGAVRIEEFINYFTYDYPAPEAGEAPFAVHLEAASAPWAPEHQLVRIGLKGFEVPWDERPPANLVFLIDVSGSMNSPNKLPLVKESLKLLVNRLGAQDRVAMVTYAGSSGVALPSTTANNRETIAHAIGQLGAGGSTHGSAGIRMAYQQARRHFIEDGVNRVILCTDGDFNVGATSRSELVDIIEAEARTGVYLSILGFGMGNYQDATLEELSNKGNGNYGYIDTIQEARKTFVEAAAGSLITIAKDVKIQVEFNPAHVQAYRLIGYENRALAAQDFNDDTKDAGEIGAGHTVTALYEIIPTGVDMEALPGVDPLRYQKPATDGPAKEATGELLVVKLRYKAPDGDVSQKIEVPLQASALKPFNETSADFKWATSVAAFGMLLRESEYAGNADFALVRKLATQALGNSTDPYRQEFLQLIDAAEQAKQQNN